MPRIGLDLPTLLHAAAELADREGFDAVTLASLAKKLDIRSPSLYNHVDGLDGLRRKLAIYGIEKLTAAMARAAVGRSGDDAVRAFGHAYVSFVREHPGLYEATLRAPDGGDIELQQVSSVLLDLTVKILEPYGLAEQPAIHALRGLRSILHGFASLEKLGGFGIPLSLDESLERLLDIYISGLKSYTFGAEK